MSPILRRRNSLRKKVNRQAVVLAGGNRLPCEIVDLSRGGAKLRTTADVSQHSYVILVCEAFGSLEGYVMWRKGQLAGIKFTDPGAATSLGPLLAAGANTEITATVKFGRRRPA